MKIMWKWRNGMKIEENEKIMKKIIINNEIMNNNNDENEMASKWKSDNEIIEK